MRPQALPCGGSGELLIPALVTAELDSLLASGPAGVEHHPLASATVRTPPRDLACATIRRC